MPRESGCGQDPGVSAWWLLLGGFYETWGMVWAWQGRIPEWEDLPKDLNSILAPQESCSPSNRTWLEVAELASLQLFWSNGIRRSRFVIRLS